MAKNSPKEALVLLLDVGSSMTTRHGTSTYLQTSVDIIQMIIQRKMFQSSKDDVALIIFGSNETSNDLAKNSDNYLHISLIQPLSEVNWNLLDYVQNKIRATNIDGDLFEALTVATDHLYEESKYKKYSDKRIIMLTDFSARSSLDHISEIKDGLSGNEIRFDVISPFSDNDDEHKELTDVQKSNQKALEKIVLGTDGAVYTYEEVLSILSTYEAKSVKSAGTKYEFKIGDSFTIPIISLIKVKESKPDLFKFKKVYAKDESVDLVIEHARFTKDDEQRDLSDKAEIVDAYKYGTSYIPIDNSDKLKYPAEKCFTLLGFTKSDNIKRHYFLGDNVSEIVTDESKCDENIQKAFVAIVEAMYEENVYGIVRKVFSSRSAPELGCLIPFIQKDSTSLLYLELPYEDDLRKFTLENFCANKKFAPNDKQLDLMDNLIDSMDLSQVNDEENEEAYNPHLTFNPYIQRMFQTLALKATNPNSELPDFDKHITSTLNRKFDDKVRNEQTKDILKRMGDEFSLRINDLKRQKLTEEKEKVKTQTQTNDDKTIDDAKQDTSELKIEDIHSMVTNDLIKNKKIGTVNPVSDFEALIDALPDEFEVFSSQIIDLIKKFTRVLIQQDDQNETFKTKIVNSLKSLRKTCLKCDKTSIFNEFLKEYKQYVFESNEFKYFKNEIKSFWSDNLASNNLTLITYDENDLSDVKSEEAKEFLELKVEPKPVEREEVLNKEEENVEDLLDMI